MDARDGRDSRIEDLYQRFARYRLHVSRHRAGDQGPEGDALGALDVRTIPAKNLRLLPYGFLSTRGTLVDLKRLLPRFLELFARSVAQIDGEQVCLQLHEAAWHSWPADEVATIRGFFQALWRFVLGSGVPGEAHVVLRAVVQLEDDLSGYLSAWLSVRTERSYLELAELVLECEWEADPEQNMWDRRPRQSTQVVQWMKGEAVREFLENAYFETNHVLISDACEALRRVTTRSSSDGE